MTQPKEEVDYDKPQYRYKNRKSRYFTSVMNEYKGVIIGGNPVFSLIGSLPIGVEYYRQERIGYELMYIHHRSPFYLNHSEFPTSDIYSNGFSLQLKQKFYNPDQRYGMFYFGHLLGSKFIDYGANVMGSELGTNNVVGAKESSYYYGIIVGNRWTKNPGNAGPTIDVYFGFGVGGRNYTPNYTDPSYDYIFEDIPKSKVFVPIFFGLNIGYLGFKKTKNLPVPAKK